MNFDIFVIITLSFYVFGIINSLRVLAQRQSPGSTLAWIMANLGMPFIGVPLYYLVGKNRIPRYARRKRKLSADLAGVASSRHLAAHDESAKQATIQSPAAAAMSKVLGSHGQVFSPVLGNMGLLIDGEQTFQEIFAAIKDAKTFIVVQYYILRADRLGVELKDLLVSKARKGVQVYLLYDDMGSFWLSRRYITELRKAGVHIERFLPVTNLSRALQANFRNHRKLVIVDGQVAFTGGLNVGDEYVGKSRQFKHWRDTHVRIEGPAVRQLLDVFLDDWYFAAGEELNLSSLQPPLVHDKAHQQLLQVVPTGPTDEELVALELLMQAIMLAETRIWISSPYLVPDPYLLRLLTMAARRGIDVRLLIPKKPDHRIVHWLSMVNAKQLAREGVKIYTYDKGFLHQKTILCDDALSILGSINFDNRAIYYNFEIAVLSYEKQFNDRVATMLEQDFASCAQLQPKKTDQSSFLQKVNIGLIRLLSPLL